MSRHARMTRTAISPRLATRIFFTESTVDSRQSTVSVGYLSTVNCRLSTILSSAKRRRAAVVRCLLVRVRQADERRLAPRTAEELETGRQRVAAGIAHRDRDRRKSRGRRENLIVVAAGRREVA